MAWKLKHECQQHLLAFMLPLSPASTSLLHQFISSAHVSHSPLLLHGYGLCVVPLSPLWTITRLQLFLWTLVAISLRSVPGLIPPPLPALLPTAPVDQIKQVRLSPHTHLPGHPPSHSLSPRASHTPPAKQFSVQFSSPLSRSVHIVSQIPH